MRINLRQSMVDCLKSRPEERLTARQIAQWIFENHREACEEKRRSSKQNLADDTALVQQLVAEIATNRPGLQKRFAQLRTTETRPRCYYWTNASEAAEVARIEQALPGKAVADICEHDLYPMLSRYVHIEHGLYPKRIDEKRGSNRRGPNGNKWLYPDLVAMEDVGADWDKEIRACVEQTGDKRARLWSFEVKLLLNRSNVREAWFQTVSNSSWANFGYLVASEIEGEAMKELRLLAASHGIGLIYLNRENPAESEIRIPARERPTIDWDACNRLTEENPDFRDFISWVRQFHQTDNARVGDWDLPADGD